MAAVTVFEEALPVYVGLKDETEPVVLMATSVEVIHEGDLVRELVFRNEGQVVGRFARSAYIWWIEDRLALFD